jgi:Ca2+-transporting ATPase
LMIQEKALSGSPEPVAKDALQPNDPTAPPEVSKNRVFMNTAVIRGRGTFVVTETGKNTRIGKAKGLANRHSGYRRTRHEMSNL